MKILAFACLLPFVAHETLIAQSSAAAAELCTVVFLDGSSVDVKHCAFQYEYGLTQTSTTYTRDARKSADLHIAVYPLTAEGRAMPLAGERTISRSELRMIQFQWSTGDPRDLRRININMRSGEQVSVYILRAAISRLVADKRAFAMAVHLVGEVRTSGKTSNWDRSIDDSISTAGAAATIAEIRFHE